LKKKSWKLKPKGQIMIDATIALICLTIYLVKTKYDPNNGGSKIKEIVLEHAETAY